MENYINIFFIDVFDVYKRLETRQPLIYTGDLRNDFSDDAEQAANVQFAVYTTTRVREKITRGASKFFSHNDLRFFFLSP